ncbi:hypothetical protein BCR43DRAFT_429678 [Syncephalastrum racemosum]|uniref:FAS1-like dehydratase domain-containing protein n=1 Tax=Syncephalastrum racemosum TaxID=13706 RepID=A0A1X2HTZ7_SYNRA|nr:hypothetical protein BCR43DRAFT_429678 [Syncephalastrum racemosum]
MARYQPSRRWYTHRVSIDDWKSRVMEHSTRSQDTITASPVDLLARTLNEPTPTKTLPSTYHHIFFPPRTYEHELAADGYETDFVPPAPFVKRLWGGAEMTYDVSNPLCIGDQVQMTTTVERVERRGEGETGSVAVWLNKDIENIHGWSMREQRLLVYVHENEPNRKPRALPAFLGSTCRLIAKRIPQFTRRVLPTPVFLFRYSALTFNAHMIHYDHLYATEVEKYPGCLVHGPLSGTLLMSLVRKYLTSQGQDSMAVSSFQYKCLMPLYVNQPFNCCGREIKTAQGRAFEVWIVNPEGHLAVKGTVQFVPIE